MSSKWKSNFCCNSSKISSSSTEVEEVKSKLESFEDMGEALIGISLVKNSRVVFEKSEGTNCSCKTLNNLS